MFAEVEAFAFDFLGDAPAGDSLGNAEGNGRTDRRPEHGDSLRSHTADEFIYIEEIREGIDVYIKILEKVL